MSSAEFTEDDIDAYFAPSRFQLAPGTRRMHAVQIRAAYSYGLKRVRSRPTGKYWRRLPAPSRARR